MEPRLKLTDLRRSMCRRDKEKLADSNLRHLYLTPPLGWSHSNFTTIFGFRKLDFLGYRTALFS